MTEESNMNKLREENGAILAKLKEVEEMAKNGVNLGEYRIKIKMHKNYDIRFLTWRQSSGQFS
jgi:hypothetical protein